MPLWGWIAIAGGVQLVIAAVIAWVLGRRMYERRLLLRLLVRAEAVEAVASALRDVLDRLVNSEDDELERFVDEPEHVERRTLAEIRSRANMLADELDRMPVPSKFKPVAVALADAAFVVWEQAASIKDEDAGEPVLVALGALDLERVRSYTEKARTLVTGACDVCGLDDTAVYGGGLYL